MKHLLIIFVVCIVLTACSGTPQDRTIAAAVAPALTAQPTSSVPPSPGATRTPEPTPSFTSSPIATKTSTITTKPSPVLTHTSTHTIVPSPTRLPTHTSTLESSNTPPPSSEATLVIITEVNKREEWVDIHNMGDTDVDLTGWNLVSERGNQGCLLGGVIRAGETLRVWSGMAQGEGYSCGYGNPIWNNSESDPAVLYNMEGIEVSRK